MEQSEAALCKKILILRNLWNNDMILGRGGFMVGGSDPHEKRTEDKLLKATKDSCKTTIEIIHGLMAQMVKDRLFNSISPKPATS